MKRIINKARKCMFWTHMAHMGDLSYTCGTSRPGTWQSSVIPQGGAPIPPYASLGEVAKKSHPFRNTALCIRRRDEGPHRHSAELSARYKKQQLGGPTEIRKLLPPARARRRCEKTGYIPHLSYLSVLTVFIFKTRDACYDHPNH